MIYPTLGLSMFAHIFVVAVKKATSFAGFDLKKNNPPKKNVFKKTLLALSIAVILEAVLFSAIGISTLAVYVGATSKESNFKIIENFYKSEKQNFTHICGAGTVCYSKTDLPDALNFPA